MTHPATLLWWEQREQCRSCAHYRHDEKLHTGERCAQAPLAHPYRSPARSQLQYCIDARLPEGPCGPDAKLFEKD